MTIAIIIFVVYVIVIIHDKFSIHNKLFCLLASWFSNQITSTAFGVVIGIYWLVTDSRGYLDAARSSYFHEIFLRKFYNDDERIFDVANNTFSLLFYLAVLHVVK